MKMPPGTLARLDGEQNVTVLAQTENRTYYIPGWHYYGVAKTERLEIVEKETL